ncbi:MAG: hypothetical protein EHM62_03640 [Methylococcus sp.]|nr:MAG: hypothetical protein EHM62_03640 [Methylococcus sp.]
MTELPEPVIAAMILAVALITTSLMRGKWPLILVLVLVALGCAEELTGQHHHVLGGLCLSLRHYLP